MAASLFEKPHPFLEIPTLFTGVAPPEVTEEQLRKVFDVLKDPPIFMHFRPSNSLLEPDGLCGEVHFDNLASAEIALATLDFSVIPETNPHYNITLSAVEYDSPNPLSCWSDAWLCFSRPVNPEDPLPSTEDLFLALRRFGPIRKMRKVEDIGFSVQFWSASDAFEAQRAGLVVEGKPMMLREYEPKIVFCKNISTNEEEVLAFFQDCGEITSIQVTEGNPPTGFVTFGTAEEAVAAIKMKNGRCMGSSIDPTGVEVCFTARSHNRIASKKPQPRPTSIRASKMPMYTGRYDLFTVHTEEPGRHEQDNIDQEAAGEGPEPAPVSESELPNLWAGGDSAGQNAGEAHPSEGSASKRQSKRVSMFQKERSQIYEDDLSPDQTIHKLKEDLLRAEAARIALESENRRLRQEQRDVQELVDQLLHRQEKWARMKEESRSLRDQLGVSERTIANLRLKLAMSDSMSESRRRMLDLEHRELEQLRRRERERAAEDARRLEETQMLVEKLKEELRIRNETPEEREQRLAAEEVAKEEREKEEQENLQRQRWAQATLQEERRCHARDLRWSSQVFWHPRASLEHFKIILDEFADSTFDENKPLTVHNIPWPTLRKPGLWDIKSLDWSAVEAFFSRAARPLMTPDEFKAFIQRVHLAFHPDRWKSRRILLSVMDDELRSNIEQAGIVVSQAVTPLWRASRAN